jgi:hypothetical protein
MLHFESPDDELPDDPSPSEILYDENDDEIIGETDDEIAEDDEVIEKDSL